jgi:hypothetical protein
MQKEDLIAKLKSDGIVSGWETRNVATVPDLSAPGTVEESTRTIAEYCQNLNEFLKLYAGVPILDFALRGGQNNPSLQGILLASLAKRPGAPGTPAGSTWSDFIRVPGFPGTTPATESFVGSGKYDADDVSTIYGSFSTFFSALSPWLQGMFDQVDAAEEAYIAGDEYEIAFDSGTPPVIVVPDPIDVDHPSILWQIAKWVSMLFSSVWGPIIIEVMKYLFRRAASGEQLSPLIKLIRKALFVKEDDLDMGLPDLTSILLMMVERAIEIYITRSDLNMSYEPTWRENYP